MFFLFFCFFLTTPEYCDLVTTVCYFPSVLFPSVRGLETTHAGRFHLHVDTICVTIIQYIQSTFPVHIQVGIGLQSSASIYFFYLSVLFLLVLCFTRWTPPAVET